MASSLADRSAQLLAPVAAAALGREHREDPVLGSTGGPAGNARLTAALGILLLPLFAIELVTLLSLHQLISWHVVVGVLLVPVAVAKAGSTGWRIVRYYTGHRPYVTAGPPPMLLRLLGPPVVLTTLAALGSGLALVALGPESSHQVLTTVVGHPVDAVTVHQGTVILWAVATGLHLLARFVPAVRLLAGRVGGHAVGRVGRWSRWVVVAVALAVGAAVAVPVLSAAAPWRVDHAGPRFGDDGTYGHR